MVLLDAQTADGSGLFVVPLDQDGVTVTAHRTIDLTRRYGVLQLDGVSVDAVSRVGQEASSWPAAAGVVVQCAESVGAGARLLELTVEHAQHRRQFGRAIGSFQALKHRMADMRIAVQAARAAMRYAAWSMELGRPDAERAVHVAKQWIGESMSALAGEALQIHGGVGFTWEHDLHLYLRRLKANELTLGSSEWHAQQLGAWCLSTT